MKPATVPALPRVGVLFDVDDTLVDLRGAMHETLLHVAGDDLVGVNRRGRRAFVEHFSMDAAGHYASYVRGELDFATQRYRRLQGALASLGRDCTRDPGEFNARFEEMVRAQWAPFADVAPTLEALRQWGVPIGAVTNNVEHYQRGKLGATGLECFEIVIGSDTAGAPKPDPRSYLAGVGALGSDVAHTLMVGDNPEHDVAGARAAGLRAVLVDRWGRYPDGGGVSSLTQILPIVRGLLDA